MAWRRRPWSHFNVSGLVDTRSLRRDGRVAGYYRCNGRRGERQDNSIEGSRVYIERTDADQSDMGVAVEGSRREPGGSSATRAGVGTRPRPTCALRPSKTREQTQSGAEIEPGCPMKHRAARLPRRAF